MSWDESRGGAGDDGRGEFRAASFLAAVRSGDGRCIAVCPLIIANGF
jgi:hypothetical protein